MARKTRKPRKRAAWRSTEEIELEPGRFLGLTRDTGEPYLWNVVGYVGFPPAYQLAREHGLISR